MNERFARRIAQLTVAAATIALLGGCATTANNPKDPYEGFNRAMFAVNEGLDKAIIKPVAKGYDAVAPLPVRTGVGNFFGNIHDVFIALNNLLQGKPGDAFSDVGRVLVNTTIGIGGAFDIASEMGLDKHGEDFGQTFAKWGVGDGPYFYWPLIGPRTTRDTFGWAVDTYVDPVWNYHDVPVRNSLGALRYVDIRAGLLPADKVVEEGALDKYSYIRDAYLQHRRSQVYDGNPPRETETE